jgi:hypothetical protein
MFSRASLLLLTMFISILSFAIQSNAELCENGDGTVTEVRNDGSVLMWVQDANAPGDQYSLDAASAAASLNVANYNDWRLPTTIPSYADTEAELGIPQSELGYMYYVELDNPEGGPLPGDPPLNTGPFDNLGSAYYWTGTVQGGTTSLIWFSFGGGSQTGGPLNDLGRVWAVRTPLPEEGASCGPVYSCVGFDAPMANGPVTVRKQRTLPLKAVLVDDAGIAKTDADISAVPVLQVTYSPDPTTVEPTDVTEEALAAGQGTVGNVFEFDFSDGKWHFNLDTGNYTAAGTYVIKMVSGDPGEYAINSESVCTATVVINH